MSAVGLRQAYLPVGRLSLTLLLFNLNCLAEFPPAGRAGIEAPLMSPVGLRQAQSDNNIKSKGHTEPDGKGCAIESESKWD